VKVLIMGGTSFVGRAIAWTASNHGHDVTVLNRGVTESDLPESVERLVGNRQGDLSALAQRHFDATVDVTAYRPSDVDRLADALGDRGGQHLQVSSISAYADSRDEGATEETLTLWDEDGLDLGGPITGDTYGPLKAAAERAAERRFGERLTRVRPTYVIGAFDATLRFPYWVARAQRGGVVVVPGPTNNAMQYVDARDLAHFVVRCLEDQTLGAYHVAGPSPADSYIAMVEAIVAQVAPNDTRVRVVDPEVIVAADLDAKFPLWGGPSSDPMLALDARAAIARGLELRPLSDSVEDTRLWWGERAWPAHWLTGAEEASLL
jgi:2'-hydroxyisoflavone reductase